MFSVSSVPTRRRLTVRYVAALSLIALLTIVGQALIQVALMERTTDGREVNLAGRQRMLSQRIAKQALAASADRDRALALEGLEADIAAWVEAHAALLDGDPLRGLPGIDDPEIHPQLAALTLVIERIVEAGAALHEALVTGDRVAADQALSSLLAAEQAFLPEMDEVVFALDQASREGTHALQRTGLALLALTLLVLGLEARLLFQPTVRQVGEALDELSAQRTMLRAIIDTIPDHVYVKDREGRAVLRNTASAAAFPGYTHEQTLGVTDGELMGQADIDRALAEDILADDLSVVQTGDPLIDHEEQMPDGGWLLTTKVPLHDHTGQVTHLVGVSRDVTALNEARDALIQAKEEAEQAARAKSAFLANMSHEIRTPLNGVLGMADLLRNTPLDGDQREYADLIHSSGTSLLHILNDILDISKIEAGRVELERAPLSVRTVTEEVLDLMAARAAEKRLDLAYFLEPDVPKLALGDALRIRQVLLNLVSNAVKFTKTGGVSICIDAAPVSDSKVGTDNACYRYHVAVRDTGIGIPADKLDGIFELFAQADTSTTRRYGGTGLGLAISQRLSSMMGGRVWAESEVGVGSTFHFTFVAERLCPEPVPAITDAPLQDRRILVVDDNAVNLRILERHVRAWGGEPILFAHPLEALAYLEDGGPADLGLLDMHMPDLEGLGLARRIRALPDSGRMSPLPLVVLSSIGDQVDAAIRAELDLAAVLTKPVKQTPLLKVVRATLDAVPSTPKPARLSTKRQDPPLIVRARKTAAKAGKDAKAGKTVAKAGTAARAGEREKAALSILLVEDQESNRTVVETMLHWLGYSADVAEDGLAALDTLERTNYDVVLMDVHMPRLDGIEATQRLRARGGRQPYVIAVTANAYAADHARCLDAGMDEHLAKPVRMEALADALERAAAQLGRERGDDSIAHAATAQPEAVAEGS